MTGPLSSARSFESGPLAFHEILDFSQPRKPREIPRERWTPQDWTLAFDRVYDFSRHPFSATGFPICPLSAQILRRYMAILSYPAEEGSRGSSKVGFSIPSALSILERSNIEEYRRLYLIWRRIQSNIKNQRGVTTGMILNMHAQACDLYRDLHPLLMDPKIPQSLVLWSNLRDCDLSRRKEIYDFLKKWNTQVTKMRLGHFENRLAEIPQEELIEARRKHYNTFRNWVSRWKELLRNLEYFGLAMEKTPTVGTMKDALTLNRERLEEEREAVQERSVDRELSLAEDRDRRVDELLSKDPASLLEDSRDSEDPGIPEHDERPPPSSTWEE